MTIETPKAGKDEAIPQVDMSRVQQTMREAARAYPAQLKELMDSANIDPAVGIGVKMFEEISPVRVDGQDYFFYGARVFPPSEGKMPFVKPHMHEVGEEPYYFPTAGGEMNFGSVVNVGERVVQWREPFAITSGAEVVIKPSEVHSFRNISTEPVDFMFACPKSHLVDHSDKMPEGDRYIVANLKNGIPAHFGIR